MIYIVMGVSSSGKTLIGKKLAKTLKLPFYDADNFHPPENIQKMESSKPLNDQDRRPWLKSLRKYEVKWDKAGGAVLACSALKKKYREVLSSPTVPVQFIYLKGSKALITERIQKRTDHFMPASLLNSQFATLEEPAYAITVSINHDPDTIVDNILRELDRRL